MTKLDDMLSKWPLPERTQLESDEAAERVVAKIRSTPTASIDESLFAAPLPKTLEDEQTSSPRTSRPGIVAPGMAVENKMSKDRTRDRTSFQELAKMATTPPPPVSIPATSSSGPHAPPPPSASSSGSTGVVRGEESSSSDSGIVDLKAIANADPSGSHRAQSTPLAAQGLFDDDSAPAKPAVSASAAAAVTSAPSSAKSVSSAVAQPAASTPSTPPKKLAEEKKGGGGVVIVIGALVAAAAIAAGGFFFVKYQRAHNTVAMTTVSTPTAQVVASNAVVLAAGSVQGAAVVAEVDNTPDTPEQLAQNGGKPRFKFHAKPGTASTTAATDTAPAATGTIDPRLVANLPTGGAGGSSGDLSEAMKAAAGNGANLNTTTGTTTGPTVQGNVAQRPSQGQVAGAIGNVMSNVKACLGSDDPISRATVTFQSDGSVKSVSVSGFASGKPSESCIKAALSKATVAPFAESTYPTTVTIRPN